jgi:hypothetical protein
MSTNKTENYQLHSWEPGDDFLRTEFNENFSLIDAAIGGKVVSGAYTGDGTASRTVPLGFTPIAVLVMTAGGQVYDVYRLYGGLAVTGSPVVQSGSGKAAVAVTEGGFTVSYLASGSYTADTNEKGTVYHYLAVA